MGSCFSASFDGHSNVYSETRSENQSGRQWDGQGLLRYEYAVGGSLSLEAPSYITRQADDNFYQGMKAGKFCYVLNSRQMGKSSLRVRTMHRLKAEGVSCASIDITALGTTGVTPEQWYFGVLDKLVGSFGLDLDFDLDGWWAANGKLSLAQRLGKFFEGVLLHRVSGPIAIFIDEIDSVLGLSFCLDDFFAVIRDCYNQRADQPSYRRLTFALIGVATPGDLILDKRRTPFNIGTAIELAGFTLEEAQPLTQGLMEVAAEPRAVLAEVLYWTGGQPYLTQKVCRLVMERQTPIGTGTEKTVVKTLVQQGVIDNWEFQDNPEHLRTIRNRILSSQTQRPGRLLAVYQRVLTDEEGIQANNSREQGELCLSGLVVKRQGRLQVYNPIYGAVFDQNWVERTVASLRPYSEALMAWQTSGGQDDSRLLRGKALDDALAWAEGRGLEEEDYQFLTASRLLQLRRAQEKREKEAALERERQQRALLELERQQRFAEQRALEMERRQRKAEQKQREAVEEANRTLTKANREVRQLVWFAALVFVALSLLAGGIGIWVRHNLLKARIAQKVVKLEQVGALTLQRLRFRETETLFMALQAGGQLQRFRKANPNFPTTSSLLWLQISLDRIRETRLDGGESDVWDMRFALRGNPIATGYADGTVRIWDFSGKELVHFRAYELGVTQILFTPDDDRLVTRGKDHSDKNVVRLWDLSGKELGQFEGHKGEVWNMRLSPKGDRLVTLGEDKTVRLWDLSGRELVRFVGHEGEVWDVQFSPKGDRLLTRGEDGTVRLWDLAGQELLRLQGYQGQIFEMQFSPQGDRLATAGEDGTVRVWTLSGQEIARFQGHEGAVWDVTFNPNGDRIATRGEDGTVRLWNLAGQEIIRFDGHQGVVWKVQFSPNGDRLVTLGEDGTARLWNLSGNEIFRFKGNRGNIESVHFSPRGDRILTRERGGVARLWNLEGTEIQSFVGHRGNVETVKFSPRGDRLITRDRDKSVRLWGLQGDELFKIDNKIGGFRDIGVNSSGDRFFTLDHEGTVQLWDLSGHELARFTSNHGEIETVKFNPKGDRLITISNLPPPPIEIGPSPNLSSQQRQDSLVQLRDLSGKELVRFEGHQGIIFDVNFNPKGDRLVTSGDDNTARLWNLSGKELVRFEGHDGFAPSANFNPQGDRIATTSSDGTVRIWNLSGRELVRLENNQRNLEKVFWSPTGDRLATIGDDGTARLWTLSGKELVSFEGHQGVVEDVRFSPQGDRLATSGKDGTTRIWDLTGNQLAEYEGVLGDFNPEWNRIAMVEGNTIKLWRVDDLDGLIDRACEKLKYYLLQTPDPTVTDDDRAMCDLSPRPKSNKIGREAIP